MIVKLEKYFDMGSSFYFEYDVDGIAAFLRVSVAGEYVDSTFKQHTPMAEEMHKQALAQIDKHYGK